MAAWTKVAGIAAIALALAMAIRVSDAQTGLEGSWMAVDAVRAGQQDRTLHGHRLQFSNDRFQITSVDKFLFGGRFATDPTATPPTIDFDQSETQTLRGVWLGIYALDGDALTICDNAYDMVKPRPKRFDDCAAPGYVTLRFTRVK
jgi:uncharacterized protein (TIGR03067 family)